MYVWKDGNKWYGPHEDNKFHGIGLYYKQGKVSVRVYVKNEMKKEIQVDISDVNF